MEKRSAETNGPSDLLTTLRDATQNEHFRIEQIVRIQSRIGDRASYTQLLEDFFGFYSSFDPCLNDALLRQSQRKELSDLIFFGSTRASWLTADLLALGHTAARIECLPRASRLPTLHSLEETLGALYVVEGSALGGQMIVRMITRQTSSALDSADLGQQIPLEALNFFNGRGAATGSGWNQFRLLSRSLQNRLDGKTVVETARAVFNALSSWMSDRADAAR